jgi:hypothetical protein
MLEKLDFCIAALINVERDFNPKFLRQIINKLQQLVHVVLFLVPESFFDSIEQFERQAILLVYIV